jgi:hypothetical protein
MAKRGSAPKTKDDLRREKRMAKGKGELKKRTRSEQKELLVKYILSRGEHLKTFFEAAPWLDSHAIKPWRAPDPVEWESTSSEEEPWVPHDDGLDRVIAVGTAGGRGIGVTEPPPRRARGGGGGGGADDGDAAMSPRAQARAQAQAKAQAKAQAQAQAQSRQFGYSAQQDEAPKKTRAELELENLDRLRTETRRANARQARARLDVHAQSTRAFYGDESDTDDAASSDSGAANPRDRYHHHRQREDNVDGGGDGDEDADGEEVVRARTAARRAARAEQRRLDHEQIDLGRDATPERWWNGEFQVLVDQLNMSRDSYGRAAMEARVESGKRMLALETAFVATTRAFAARIAMLIPVQRAGGEPTPTSWADKGVAHDSNGQAGVLAPFLDAAPGSRRLGVAARPPATEVHPNAPGAYVVLGSSVPTGAGPVGKNDGGPFDREKAPPDHFDVTDSLARSAAQFREEIGWPESAEDRLDEYFSEYVRDGILYRVVRTGTPAAKAIGHHLRTLQHVAAHGAGEILALPLVAVVDFLGYRIMARALMPIPEDDEINKPVIRPEYSNRFGGPSAAPAPPATTPYRHVSARASGGGGGGGRLALTGDARDRSPSGRRSRPRPRGSRDGRGINSTQRMTGAGKTNYADSSDDDSYSDDDDDGYTVDGDGNRVAAGGKGGADNNNDDDAAAGVLGGRVTKTSFAAPNAGPGGAGSNGGKDGGKDAAAAASARSKKRSGRRALLASPAHTSKQLGRFAREVTPSVPSRPFGHVPDVMVPLAPGHSVRVSMARGEPRAQRLMREGREARAGGGGGPGSSWADQQAIAGAAAPGTPARASKGGASSVMAGFQTPTALSRRDRSPAPPDHNNNNSNNNDNSSLSPKKRHPAHPVHRGARGSSPLVNRRPARLPDARSQLAQRTYHARVIDGTSLPAIQTATGHAVPPSATQQRRRREKDARDHAAMYPQRSARFLRTFRTRTVTEAALDVLPATTAKARTRQDRQRSLPLLSNLHPDFVSRLSALATRLNVAFGPPASHAQLNVSHLGCWERTLRVGDDDRVYFHSPQLLYPREPLNSDGSRPVGGGNSSEFSTPGRGGGPDAQNNGVDGGGGGGGGGGGRRPAVPTTNEVMSPKAFRAGDAADHGEMGRPTMATAPYLRFEAVLSAEVPLCSAEACTHADCEGAVLNVMSRLYGKEDGIDENVDPEDGSGGDDDDNDDGNVDDDDVDDDRYGRGGGARGGAGGNTRGQSGRGGQRRGLSGQNSANANANVNANASASASAKHKSRQGGSGILGSTQSRRAAGTATGAERAASGSLSKNVAFKRLGRGGGGGGGGGVGSGTAEATTSSTLLSTRKHSDLATPLGFAALSVLLTRAFLQPHWSSPPEHASLTCALHYHGYHLDSLGELRRQVARVHAGRGGATGDNRLGAKSHQLLLLNEVVVREMGCRSIKAVVLEFVRGTGGPGTAPRSSLAAGLRGGRSGDRHHNHNHNHSHSHTDTGNGGGGAGGRNQQQQSNSAAGPVTDVLSARRRLRAVLNLILGQSPDAIEFWRETVTGVLVRKFGFLRTPEVEQKVSGVLRRAVALDNPAFLDRLQYLTGVRLSRAFVERARADPAAAYASAEPVTLRDVRRPIPVVKGTSVWISPGEVITQEAALMDEADADEYIEHGAGGAEAASSSASSAAAADPTGAGIAARAAGAAAADADRGVAAGSSRTGAASGVGWSGLRTGGAAGAGERFDQHARGTKERVVDWAIRQFSDMHAEDPYNADHLTQWGIALTLKAHILAGREHRARRRLPDHQRRIEITEDPASVTKVTDPSGHFAAAGDLFERALYLAPDDHRALAAWGTVLAQRAVFARDVGFYKPARELAHAARLKFESVLRRRPHDNLMRANLGKILVVEATSFPDLDQHRPGTLFYSSRGKDLSERYPRFARCLVVFKLLQSIDKIERGISVLQECLDREPDFKFARDCHRDACIMYASRFLSKHNHIN